jgi:hypothetical protein
MNYSYIKIYFGSLYIIQYRVLYQSSHNYLNAIHRSLIVHYKEHLGDLGNNVECKA